MRVKRQKRHRKTVRFYTACFGFRDPYKVLCDGTFVHHLLANAITPADTAFSNVLGADVKIFTTRCVLAELNSLGDDYKDTLNAARNLIPARCDHEKRKSAVDCIAEIVGENNPEHFFVGTQDVELRKKFQEVPGVPLIYGLRKALLLEPPSKSQQKFAKSSEEERLHMTDLELKMLKMKKNSRVAIKEASDSPDALEGVDDKPSQIQFMMLKNEKKRIDMKDKVQFKRKRAKGPNPLSCKKKKSGNQNTAPQKEAKDGEQTMRSRSRKRKRKRSPKNKNVTESAS